MTEPLISAPHVFYSVPELSVIKDIRVMRNTKVKTIGYICRKNQCVLKDSPESEVSVPLDLTHIHTDILEIHPYIIFGIICTVNGLPVIIVKTVKKFTLNRADLDEYKKQCLSLRSRLKQLDSITNLGKTYNWDG